MDLDSSISRQYPTGSKPLPMKWLDRMRGNCRLQLNSKAEDKWTVAFGALAVVVSYLVDSKKKVYRIQFV